MKHNDSGCHCSTRDYKNPENIYSLENFPKFISTSRYRCLFGYEDPYCDCGYCLGGCKQRKSWKYYRKHQWRE